MKAKLRSAHIDNDEKKKLPEFFFFTDNKK